MHTGNGDNLQVPMCMVQEGSDTGAVWLIPITDETLASQEEEEEVCRVQQCTP